MWLEIPSRMLLHLSSSWLSLACVAADSDEEENEDDELLLDFDMVAGTEIGGKRARGA